MVGALAILVGILALCVAGYEAAGLRKGRQLRLANENLREFSARARHGSS
jgi:hypothetical protein